MNNCLIIAGEKSGEEHVQSFFADLKKLCPDFSFWGVGGDWMRSEGVELLFHLNDFSSMGFSEVVGKIPFYIQTKKFIISECRRRKTAYAILIDFQDFNLRLAQALKKIGVQVLYFVAPQAWAWRPKRAQVIAKTVHTLFSILPFEEKWFRQHGVKNIVSVPHPLMRRHRAFLKRHAEQLDERRGKDLKGQINLLILPGSRASEIRYHLPFYMECIRHLRHTYPIRVSLSRSRNLPFEIFRPYLSQVECVIEEEELPQTFLNTDLAFATSGTVTLLSALFETPTIIFYRGSLLNQFIFENFIQYSGHIGLANLVAQEQIFPELIQDQVNSFNVDRIIQSWSENSASFLQVREKLGELARAMPDDEGLTAITMAKILKEDHDLKAASGMENASC
ncbi:MAG: lipid-A-disaccharide synthase [Bdellovibrio sp.]|nr:lipid-A-disaccharide synthase [Bdellovibrio sp.]